jgi:uncharacterized protein YndB with AHSA1/START domain
MSTKESAAQTKPFTIEKIYNAPVSQVWQAITDKNKMKEWYFDVSAFKAEVGFEFQFTGQGAEGEKYVHLCKITEVIVEKKLAYTWRYEGLAGNSVVTFELFPSGDKTTIKLTHEGLDSFAGNGPSFAKESFAMGWTEIIGKSLKEYVEKK